MFHVNHRRVLQESIAYVSVFPEGQQFNPRRTQGLGKQVRLGSRCGTAPALRIADLPQNSPAPQMVRGPQYRTDLNHLQCFT